jgi:hypothetical protein
MTRVETDYLVGHLIREVDDGDRDFWFAVTGHPKTLDGHVTLWLSRGAAEYLLTVGLLSSVDEYEPESWIMGMGEVIITNKTIADIDLLIDGDNYFRLASGSSYYSLQGRKVEITQISIQTPSGDKYLTPRPHECVLPDSHSWDKSQPEWFCPTEGCPKKWRLEKYHTGGYPGRQPRYGWREKLIWMAKIGEFYVSNMDEDAQLKTNAAPGDEIRIIVQVNDRGAMVIKKLEVVKKHECDIPSAQEYGILNHRFWACPDCGRKYGAVAQEIQYKWVERPSSPTWTHK